MRKQDVAEKATTEALQLNLKAVSRGGRFEGIRYYKALSKIFDRSLESGDRITGFRSNYQGLIPTQTGLIAARASLLSLCVDRDLPITMEDVDFISNSSKFFLGLSISGCFILIDSLESSSLASRLGVYAAVSSDMPKQKSTSRNIYPRHIKSYTIRKYGRMSAKVSEAAPEKSRQEKISEAKAATLKYYADMARKAQKTYMIKFNAMTP